MGEGLVRETVFFSVFRATNRVGKRYILYFEAEDWRITDESNWGKALARILSFVSEPLGVIFSTAARCGESNFSLGPGSSAGYF